MRAFMYLFAVLFLFTSQASFADKIYRWTDAEGQIHFGSHPPAQSKQTEEVVIRAHSPSSTGASKANDSADSKAKTNAKDEEKQAQVQNENTEPAIDPEIAARNCRVAKEQKQLLSENFSRRFQQPDGEVRPLTDAERADRLRQMNEAIEKYCK